MMLNRSTNHRAHRVAAVSVTLALLAACGDGGDGGAAANPDAGGSTTTIEAMPDTDAATTVAPATTVPRATSAPPATTQDTGSEDDEGAEGDEVVAEVVDAVVVATIELGRGDLGLLTSDGEAIWASGHGGVVVRIDPDTGEVTELDIGGGQISGPLLPTVVGESIWFSAIQGSHIVRLDRTTLTADPPIEVPGDGGVVVAGPGDEQLWLAYLDPAGLRPFDVTSGTVGELLTVGAEGEIIGPTAAFGALWLPLYDEREIVQLDGAGAELARLSTGVGPSYVRELGGALWHPNWVDGTVARVDPATLDVRIVDLNAGGPTIETPSAVVGTDEAMWVRAARMLDGAAMVFRIDPDGGSVAGRRTLPDGRRLHQIGGMVTVGDRLFVLDRPGRVLLELDTDQFLVDDLPPATSAAEEPDEVEDPDEADVAEAVRTLLATATTPEQLADGIVDGDRLTEQIAAFKQFFVDNLPGEEYVGDASSVRIDGDVAEIEFFIVVAGEPIVEAIRGTAVRQEDRWLLSADSFCRLIATGGIDCPADLELRG